MSRLASARFFLVLKFPFLLISWRAHLKAQERSAIEGGSRVPDCPLNHECSYMCIPYTFPVLLIVCHVHCALTLGVPNCLHLHTDPICVDVSVGNSPRALVYW